MDADCGTDVDGEWVYDDDDYLSEEDVCKRSQECLEDENQADLFSDKGSSWEPPNNSSLKHFGDSVGVNQRATAVTKKLEAKTVSGV